MWLYYHNSSDKPFDALKSVNTPSLEPFLKLSCPPFFYVGVDLKPKVPMHSVFLFLIRCKQLFLMSPFIQVNPL